MNIPNPIESAPAFGGRLGLSTSSASDLAILRALGVEPVYQPRHHNGYQRIPLLGGLLSPPGRHRADPDALPPGTFPVIFSG
jgi:hypothetical protein